MKKPGTSKVALDPFETGFARLAGQIGALVTKELGTHAACIVIAIRPEKSLILTGPATHFDHGIAGKCDEYEAATMIDILNESYGGVRKWAPDVSGAPEVEKN